MKKIALLFCLFVFCFCCTLSLAEEPAELTCMDIPWFSTPKEASAILVKAEMIAKGVAFGEKDVNSFPTLQDMKEKYGIVCVPSSIATDPKDQECPYIHIGQESRKYPPLSRKLATIRLIKGIKGKYANNRIAGLALNFTSDDENRQLVECVISMSGGADTEEVLAALKKSYGEPTAEKGKQYIWLGANSTIMIYDMRATYHQSHIAFTTIDGLNLAESYDIQVPE